MIFLSEASLCSNKHAVFCKGKHSQGAANYLKLRSFGYCKQQLIDPWRGSPGWHEFVAGVKLTPLGTISTSKSDPLDVS